MKKFVWMIVLVLAVSFMVAACGEKEEPKKDDGGTTTTGGEVKTEPTAYQPVKFGELEYLITKAEVKPQLTLGGIAMGEEAGKVYVHVTYTVKNNGTAEVDYNSVLAGGKLYIAPDKTVDNELLADGVLNEKLAPGKELKGEFFFKVDGDEKFSITGLKMEINSLDFLGNTKAEFIL